MKKIRYLAVIGAFVMAFAKIQNLDKKVADLEAQIQSQLTIDPEEISRSFREITQRFRARRSHGANNDSVPTLS